jgi:hypothetical protein
MVRSVAVTLLPPALSRYKRPAVFRGRVVPALAAEPVARLAATHAEPIWRRTYLRWRRCLPNTRHR